MRTLAVLLALTLSACALQEDHTLKWNVDQLYQYAQNSQHEGDYERAAKYYDKVLARFPYGTLAQQSALNMAYSYHRAGEHDKALHAIDTFIRTYPQHPQIDYAYYMRGVIAYERGDAWFKRLTPINQAQTDPKMLRKAFSAFEDLLKQYPNSQYAEDSRKRMIYLRNVLGQHELEVAEMYLYQGAWIAAAERAQTVVEYYQKTPSTPYALAVLKRAYQELGDHKREQDSLQLLEQNFPEALQLGEIQRILAGRLKRKDTLWGIVNSKLKI